MTKPDSKRIENIFNSFNGKKILIIGDVMLDAYWFGQVNRISPEAPVPVVLIKNTEFRLGGAANVALNIKAMKAKPILVSLIGKDNEGIIFKDLLSEFGIDSGFISISTNRPTTVKTRVIGNHQQQLIRLDNEITDDLSIEEYNIIKENAFSVLEQADAIIFQDYDKGVLNKKLIDEITQVANSKNVPIIVDPKKRNFNNYKNSTLFKPNLKELQEGLNFKIPKPITLDSLRKATDLLFIQQKIKIALITLSEDGIYVRDEHTELIIPSHKRTIFDVSGAGDTVIAIAALSLSSGIDIDLLAALSNIAGGLVCEKVGVVPIERQEFLEECINLLS